MDEGELFENVASQIDESVTILEDRIQKLEELARTYQAPEQLGKSAIMVFLVRSLNLWVRIIRFSAAKIRLEDNDEHFFALSNMRTLTDVFGRIICMLEKDDEDTQALMCILYMLYTSSKLDDTVYQGWLTMFDGYPALQNVNLPVTARECDWRWYRNSGYIFENNSTILTADILRKHTIDTSEVFSNRSIYDIFAHLSEILHGNPLYHNEPHNERFWLAAMSISLTANVIEVVDRRFLDKVRPRDFRVWLQKVEKFKSVFLQEWTGRMRNNNQT